MTHCLCPAAAPSAAPLCSDGQQERNSELWQKGLTCGNEMRLNHQIPGKIIKKKKQKGIIRGHLVPSQKDPPRWSYSSGLHNLLLQQAKRSRFPNSFGNALCCLHILVTEKFFTRLSHSCCNYSPLGLPSRHGHDRAAAHPAPKSSSEEEDSFLPLLHSVKIQVFPEPVCIPWLNRQAAC